MWVIVWREVVFIKIGFIGGGVVLVGLVRRSVFDELTLRVI